MFSRVAALSTLAFVALAAAASNCNTGPVQCCNKLERADSAAGAAILSVLGVAVQDVTAKIGLECSPISAVGVGSGNTCSSQPVCCENNNVGGLISIGCAPIML
ncbi:fungal hydrophobin [Earliella scabrosa]|nr:fungal hydrophobin [Earliella scabrosa]